MDIIDRYPLSASAPGKVILFGEHFVIYNNVAIVTAINRRCFAKAESTQNLDIRITGDQRMGCNLDGLQSAGKLVPSYGNKMLRPISTLCRSILSEISLGTGLEIQMKSELPIGFGLGSSAASCVAAAGLLESILRYKTGRGKSAVDRKWVCGKALEGERLIHKQSSGVDCYVSTYGGLVHFAGLSEVTPIHRGSLPIFLINTHKRHETSELVSQVRRFRQTKVAVFNELVKDATEICSSALKAIAKGSIEEIGMLMTENHKLLKKIGVSNAETEKIVSICNKCGSLGAKITGAGGGGCILVLASPEVAPILNGALTEVGLRLEAIEIETNGLIVD
jgi:mevalonate kinase